LRGKLSLLLGGLLASGLAVAESTPPGFNTPIPSSIMTPDSVETSIGRLNFFDGIPDKKTVEAVYENLDRMRATEAFLEMVPLASVEALRVGMESIGIDAANKVMLYDGLMDSNSLFLTGNTDTVYAIGLLNLERDGPTVVEIPPGAGPGTVNDAYFRFVIDMGGPGPDRGKGGKYLILPPGYEGAVPEGYFTAESTSYINWLPLRGLLQGGKTDAPNKMWKEGLKIYPLSQKDHPPKMEFISGTGLVVNTVHANDETFFEEVNDVIQREPLSFLDDELRGTLGSIGMEKGKAFNPDARMRAILKDAVAIANATARAIAFRSRSDGVKIFGDDSVWYSAFDGFNYLWLRSDGAGGRNKDARTMFYYIATVNTPAMVLELPGIGSQYALAASDSKGRDLDGSKTYKVNIPANVPAKNFWSVVVYDPQTRSMLQTNQPYPSKNDQRDRDMVVNADGSITLWFGPEAPKGQEANWIQTVPNKSWFTILRLYGPLEPWFKREWKPGNIELVN
jgi:hypothetical protein